MKKLLRAAAIAVASTALVAGTTTGSVAAPGQSTVITLQPTVLSGSTSGSTTVLPLTIQGTQPFQATVVVNGVALPAPIYVYSAGIYYNRAWGAGAVKLINFRDIRGGAIAGASNEVNVRYGVKFLDGFKVRKIGKKLTFKTTVRYVNNAGKSIGIRKATLQVKKGSKWRTLKKLKLNKKGKATYRKSDRKKRSYRLVIKETGTYGGAVIKGNRKI
jgi:hypothetical protein